MNFTLLVAVLLTAIAFVGIVIALPNAIAPRSYNVQKMEPYECGIPTRGKSWMQFRVGYYLFAILFLMFEVETVFLFPWAVIARELGAAGTFQYFIFPYYTWFWALHMPGGKERWNGSKETNHKVYSL